ncbi:BCCT family transporter, partial [Salmonella enterica subsp. enterica serovar Kentucky]|nr:BCCT family transporter [Salmonella enterica subsp. enterica serovar Kentucky]
LDTRLTSSALTLALAAVVIPFTADWQLPLLNGVVVRWIENGHGMLLMHLPRMLFYTDAIGKGGFPQGWTVFYWAWWVIYAIQMS